MAFPLQFPIQFTTTQSSTIFNIDFRLIVQKPSGDKYYPDVVRADIDRKIPFDVDTADIEIYTNTNSSTSSYMSPVNVDDIVRLQVDFRQTGQKPVWIDLFEGRITETESKLQQGDNNTVLNCRGHEEELLYRIITSDYSVSSSTSGTIVNDMVTDYLSRITAGDIDTSGSSELTSFNANAEQKYVSDVIRQLEKIENYGYAFQVQTEYDSDGNLSNVYADWQPVPSSVSDRFAVKEKTGKLVSASFRTSINELYNDVTIYGDDSSPQREGTATDSDSQSDYNTRHYVDSDLGLNTDALCSSLANAILEENKQPKISGQATVLGSPYVHPADYIYVKIPSIVVDGSTVDDTYRVKRVMHRISKGQFETTVDLGELTLETYEMISQLYAKQGQNNRNFII